jgi:preprotein translocase subunit SecE
MNRQTKRAMAKQQQKERPAAPRKQPPPGKDKKKRKSFTQFLKEVRLELKKVQWPTRKELGAYTLVVFVSVVVLTTYVFGLDYVFSKAVLKIFGA